MAITMQRLRYLTTIRIYLLLIGVLGISVLLLGFWQLYSNPPESSFYWLVLLGVVAALAPMSVAVSEDAGINYGVGPAVSLAAIPSFGAEAAALLVAIYSIAVWLRRPADRKTWKKSGRQLLFNTSMHAIAIYCAGLIFFGFRHLFGVEPTWLMLLPWIPAAIIYEEVNIWLLIGILRLQNGPSVHPLTIWREERSTSQIIILASALGGGTLGYAVEVYHAEGAIAFFWPILLSAYAFRLYVNQMRSHLENLENIVAERTKDLAQLNRQKDAYLAVLTHDMMTPLTSIQLCAEELQADPTAAVDNPNLVNFLLRSQRTLFTMVRNILDIEKLQSGGSLTSKKSLCDLGQLLTQIVEILQNEASEKNVKISCEVHAEPLQLYADRHQLERILLNLLANGVKYTPQGGAVHVSADQAGDQVVLHCSDTGYGIPQEELPYIFDRFRRVSQHQDKATGTGLGLAITKALVEEHGGEITVVSQVGKGSTFTVRLPIGTNAAYVEVA